MNRKSLLIVALVPLVSGCSSDGDPTIDVCSLGDLSGILPSREHNISGTLFTDGVDYSQFSSERCMDRWYRLDLSSMDAAERRTFYDSLYAHREETGVGVSRTHLIVRGRTEVRGASTFVNVREVVSYSHSEFDQSGS